MPKDKGTTALNEGDDCNLKLKLVIIGESTVGKTSLLRILRGEEFSPTLVTTIGIDFFRKVFHVGNTDVQLEIWDTAGQERFYSMTSFTYRGAKGLIFVYDITKLTSFQRLRTHWIKNLDQEQKDPIPMFLIGNKIDLDERREVSEEAGRLLQEQQSLFGFYETSACTGFNVMDAFSDIAEKLAGVWDLSGTIMCSPTEKISPTAGGKANRMSQAIWPFKPAKNKKSKDSIVLRQSSLVESSRKLSRTQNCCPKG